VVHLTSFKNTQYLYNRKFFSHLTKSFIFQVISLSLVSLMTATTNLWPLTLAW